MREREDGPLLVRLDGTTAVLTLNRPEARNAFNYELLDALRHGVTDAGADSRVRALVITGAGDRAFCAGADIRQMQTMDEHAGRRWSQLGHDVFQAIEDCGKPVIAAIQATAVGGGCELALACDLRFMAETAQIGQPEIKLGLIPGWGGTQRLPRLVGPGVAKDLIFTGRLLSAAEALRVGLVNAIVPPDRLLAHAVEYAAQFASLPPLALTYAKRAINLGLDAGLRAGIAIEADLIAQCFQTEDRWEGFAAFLEKRPARFQGQ